MYKSVYQIILLISLFVYIKPAWTADDRAICDDILNAEKLVTNEELFLSYRENRHKNAFAENDTTAIRILSRVPFDQIPNDIRGEIEKDWLDLKSDPILITDDIKELTSGSFYCGACGERIRTHLGAFLGSSLFDKVILRHDAQTPVPSRNPVSRFLNRKEFNKLVDQHSRLRNYFDYHSKLYGNLVLIYVRGTLVGSLKLTSDDNAYDFLALRNVQDSFGRLVMVKGGIYHLPLKLMNEQILPMGFKKPRKPWIRMDFDNLNIKPNGFLFNWSAWSTSIVFSLASAEVYEAYLQSLAAADKNKSKSIDPIIAENIRSHVWRNILPLLTDQRKRIELPEQ